MPSVRVHGSRPRLLMLLSLMTALPLVAVAPSVASAQVTASQSAQVLLDAAAGFEREGRWDVAEAIYEHILERYQGTAAADVARERLTGPSGERVDRTSRVELPVFGSLYGLWLGVAVPSALGDPDSQAYGVGLLLGGPLGLFSARALNNSRPITEGQARAISWGGIWGTWQGFGWTEALQLGVDEICDGSDCFPTEDGDEELFAGMILGGLAGIGTGIVISKNPVRSGVSSAAQGGSTWGSIYGAMAAGILRPDDGHPTLITSLIAGNVGLVAGAALARKYDVSRPRVRMINLGALVGGLGGLGIDLLLEPDDDPTAIAIPLATSVGGLLVAAYATRDDRATGPAPAPADDADHALFGFRDGTLSMNPPLPMPTMLPMDDANGRTRWRPGLRIDLLRARF